MVETRATNGDVYTRIVSPYRRMKIIYAWVFHYVVLSQNFFIQLRISVCTSVTIQVVGTTGNGDVMWSWDNLWVGCKKKSHVTSSKLDNILNLETVKFILPHKVPWYISMNTTGFRVPVRSYSKYIPGHLSSFGFKTRENFLAISVQINVVDNFNLELVDVSDTINRHDNAITLSLVSWPQSNRLISLILYILVFVRPLGTIIGYL